MTSARQQRAGDRNVILETAAGIVAGILARGGFALSEPVSAQFQTNARGSSGVGVTVRLANPSEAGAALAAIRAHLGYASGVDAVRVT